MKPQQIVRPGRIDHLGDDGRGYPIISTVGRDETGANFGSVNERRKLALATFDWCAVCGLPFRSETRWQVVVGDGLALGVDQRDIRYFGEAPVHEICLVYAAQVCPHLSSPGHRLGDQYRAGRRREPTIRLAGFERTSEVRAFKSGLQRDAFVLHFAHTGFVGEIIYESPVELHDHYMALLERGGCPGSFFDGT
ncbi:hypothetical protein AB0I81_63695 [Nonomuraea sp. NPDC050404]|uniref:hypothetical protein n=1 Tax=Nonomuraea sp. NPDC050404 TaxID=3155783 RepID=UPI0033FB9F51